MAKKNSKRKEILSVCTDREDEISFVDNPVIKGETIAAFDFSSPEDSQHI